MTSLDQTQIDQQLAQLPSWRYSNGEISKTYTLNSFAFAIEFVRQIGQLAELANHHPDIDIRFNKVKVKLSTRTDKGVTEQDIELAHQIERLLDEGDGER